MLYKKIALLCGLVLFSLQSNAATEVTIIGDNGYKPYIYSDGGVAKGIYAEIITAAFAKMSDYTLKWDLKVWKRGLSDLESGKGFALVPPYYRPDDRPYIDPYSEALLDEKVVLVCRKEVLNKERATFPDDYVGLKFGNNTGYATLGDDFFNLVKEGKITLHEAPSTEANLKKITAGRIDCYGNDRMVIATSLKDMGSALGTDVDVAHDVKTEKGFLGFSRDGQFPYKDDFVNQFNAVIKEMKSNGEIEAIINKYL